jgi:hypothetical protein
VKDCPVRDRPTKFNDTPTEKDAWLDEIEEFCPCDDDFDAASCALIADELDLYRIIGEADDAFGDLAEHWDGCVWEHSLSVALEQCCHEGVLLPREQRALRLKSCPKEVQDGLNYFIGHCPSHVLHYLALFHSVLVRVERAKRSGSPDWRPDKPPPRSPNHDTVFFRPPKLKVRNYAR